MFPTTRAGIRSARSRRLRSTTAGSCSPRASAYAASSPTRTSASRSRRVVHARRAAGRLYRGARTRRVGDEPQARPAAPRGARAHGSSAAAPAARAADRRRRSASASATLEITDPFAALRPPNDQSFTRGNPWFPHEPPPSRPLLSTASGPPGRHSRPPAARDRRNRTASTSGDSQRSTTEERPQKTLNRQTRRPAGSDGGI